MVCSVDRHPAGHLVKASCNCFCIKTSETSLSFWKFCEFRIIKFINPDPHEPHLHCVKAVCCRRMSRWIACKLFEDVSDKMRKYGDHLTPSHLCETNDSKINRKQRHRKPCETRDQRSLSESMSRDKQSLYFNIYSFSFLQKINQHFLNYLNKIDINKKTQNDYQQKIFKRGLLCSWISHRWTFRNT